jgi:hypothetical protein
MARAMAMYAAPARATANANRQKARATVSGSRKVCVTVIGNPRERATGIASPRAPAMATPGAKPRGTATANPPNSHAMRAFAAIALTLLVTGLVRAEEKPWSFTRIIKPAAPKVSDLKWCRDGVDVFVLAKLDAKTLAPNPDADRATLLRRATFDLTGLPPTIEEIDAFTRDPAGDDQAFAKVLDRLLASPRFGERWARHWLDIAHYADSVGRTMNATFPYAFRYRDYVIDAFNKDKPYNRFIGEQIAGDLLPFKSVEERRENLTATALLTLSAVDLTNRGEQLIMDRVDDQIDVTTRALLGLTVSCARCHNHKTDPIKQRDYYALAGIFYSTEAWPGQPSDSLGRNGYVDEDLLLKLPPLKGIGGLVSNMRGKSPTKADDEADSMMEMQRAKGYPVTFAFRPDRAMGVLEGEPRDCPLRIKGDPHDRDEAPPRGEFALPGLPRLPKISDKESGRLQLAQWLIAPENPLTARVFVNRVWQHLFGRGIVRTVDDFGLTGEAPTHPELLDHLATRFVEGGWSVKKLLRAVMLSRTYRLSSAGDPAREKVDDGSAFFWRALPRRIEIEPLRDSLLFLGGTLKFERPEGIQVAGFGGKGRAAWARSLMPETAPVRTIYLPVLRSLVPSMHELFDFPDPSQIKGQREVTTVSSQALFLMNNAMVEDAARGLAEQLLVSKGKDDAARLEQAWLRTFGRKPSADEATDAKKFLSGLKGTVEYRWSTFIQALFASAEFRYLL